MKKALKYIASIRTGLFERPQPKGEIVYLQFRHFDASGGLYDNPFPDLACSGKVVKHLLRPGDVLFAAKGSDHFAATYIDGYPAAVASSSFFVIRLNDETITPEFLTWTLNRPPAQEYFESKARGSGIPSVTKTALEELIIAIPPLEIQKKIMEIDKLRTKEQEIYRRLSKLRDDQTLLTLSKYLNKL